MATYAAARQGDWANFGSKQAGVWKVTHDNSTQYFDTGMGKVWFAIPMSETASGACSQTVFNSNDGTADSAAGYVYHSVEGDGDITYYLVIGW